MFTGFGMGLGGGLMMVLVWGGLILLAVWLVKSLFPANSQTPRSQPSTSAIDILNQRYARGEITKDQYEQMRRDLSA
jgi:putative membrane protein